MTGPELIQVVDQYDHPLFGATKDDIQKHKLWYRVARIMVEDGQGNLLLQKRASDKRLFPGRWDNSAAGHVDMGESYLEAAERELAEEVGIRGVPLEKINRYRSYNEDMNAGLILKEWQTVFRAVVPPDTVLDFANDEVQTAEWHSIPDVKSMIGNDLEVATPGLVYAITTYY
jgi:isopentenyl-diphosphate delta-isomerase